MSINDITSELGKGGAFEGWRLPTHTEVFNMSQQFFGERLGFEIDKDNRNFCKPCARETTIARYMPFKDALGKSDLNKTMSYGMYVNNEYDNLQEVLVSGMQMNSSRNEAKISLRSTSNQGSITYSRDYDRGDYGTYLVADGGVTLSTRRDPSLTANNSNAPSDISIAFVSLLPLLGFRLARRRKK
jgi:hypothetical protein